MADHGSPFAGFAAAFFSRWYIVLTGPLAIPLTALGVSLTTGRLQLGFVVALIIAVIVTAYFVWRGENRAAIAARQRATELERQIRPKLWLSFSIDDTGCVRPGARVLIPVSDTEAVTAGVTYYRVRVDAVSALAIDGCAGRLTAIFRNGVSLMSGEGVPLPFAPAEAPDALAKRVYPQRPEYLDVLMISSNNHVLPCAYRGAGPNGGSWTELFKEPGEYRFRVVVTAGPTTSSIDLLLTWTGEHQAVDIKKAA
jgi:hypothetical protein